MQEATDLPQDKELVAERIRLAALSLDLAVGLTEAGSLSETLQRCAVAMVDQLSGASARIWTLNDMTVEGGRRWWGMCLGAPASSRLRAAQTVARSWREPDAQNRIWR